MKKEVGCILANRKSINIDTINLAVHSLQCCKNHLVLAINDLMHYMWTIVTLHTGIQCFMCLALGDSNYTYVLTDSSKKKIQKIDNGEIQEFPRLSWEAFPKLYEGIKDPSRMRRYIYSNQFVADDSQDKAVFLLHDWRNKIIHFGVWSTLTYEDNFIDILNRCIPLVEFFGKRDSNVVFNDSSVRTTYDSTLTALKAEISRR